MLAWIIPLTIFVGGGRVSQILFMFIDVPLIVSVVFCLYWINEYVTSIGFMLTESDIIVKRGVWWRHRRTVPYNRITNIDIAQGPISRMLGLGAVAVQTAGYSAAGGTSRRAEANIFGIQNFDGVRETILDLLRARRPIAVEAGTEEPSDINLQILQELRKIREALSKD